MVNKTKSAFTLAEVLITLVIIGIVATLTIPTAINKYQKEQTVSQLKQIYSQLNQAVRLAVPKYGEPSTWDYSISTSEFFDRYLTNFVTVKELVYNANEVPYKGCNSNIENGLLIMKSGSKIKVLNSGAMIFTRTDNNNVRRKGFVVDINGFKGPNKFGRDTFFFYLLGTRGEIVAFQWDDGTDIISIDSYPSREKLKNGPSIQNYQCNKNGRGMWCAALIMADGWQIKDDYPW